MYILFQCGKNFWSEYMYKQLSTVYSPCWQGVGRLKSSLYLISSRDPRLQLTEGCPLWLLGYIVNLTGTFRLGQCFPPAPLLCASFLSSNPVQTKPGDYGTFLGYAREFNMGCLPCCRQLMKTQKSHPLWRCQVRRSLRLCHSQWFLTVEEFIRGNWVFHFWRKIKWLTSESRT